MNKKTLVIIAIGIITIGVASAAVLMMPQENQTNRSTTSSPSTTDEMNDLPASSTSSEAAQSGEGTYEGTYVDYSEDIIANTNGTKILFFHASWCPQCIDLERSIKSGDIPAGVTIIKVDYDSNQQLRQRYGVTIQTTLVRVDDSGQKVDSFVAYDDPTLQSIKDTLL